MYQTWKNEIGDSDSEAKWQALRLEKFCDGRMDGARVLDLGCNAGYFSGKCLDAGAETVLGVDTDPEMITLARARYPGAQFEVADFSHPEMLAGDCDLILMLSALHYADDLPNLFCGVWEALDDDGLFVLECGVFPGCGDFSQHVTREDETTVLHHTIGYLTRLLSRAGLTVRNRGKSVKQKGDPIDRYVFHCAKQVRTLVVVSGESFSGKTQLCRDLHAKAFEFDRFVLDSAKYVKSEGSGSHWTEMVEGQDLRDFYLRIQHEPADYSAMIEAAFEAFPYDPVVVVDAHEAVADGLIDYVNFHGWRVWETTLCD